MDKEINGITQIKIIKINYKWFVIKYYASSHYQFHQWNSLQITFYLSPKNNKWLNKSGCQQHWTLIYNSTILILQGYLCFYSLCLEGGATTEYGEEILSGRRRWIAYFFVFLRWKIKKNETKKYQFVRLFQNNILKINRSHIKSQLLISSLFRSRNPDLKISLFFTYNIKPFVFCSSFWF